MIAGEFIRRVEALRAELWYGLTRLVTTEVTKHSITGIASR